MRHIAVDGCVQPSFIEPMQVTPVRELPDGGAYGNSIRVTAESGFSNSGQLIRDLANQELEFSYAQEKALGLLDKKECKYARKPWALCLRQVLVREG